MATGIVIASRESDGGACGNFDSDSRGVGGAGFMGVWIFAEKISTNILCEIVGADVDRHTRLCPPS